MFLRSVDRYNLRYTTYVVMDILVSQGQLQQIRRRLVSEGQLQIRRSSSN